MKIKNFLLIKPFFLVTAIHGMCIVTIDLTVSLTRLG